VIGHATRAIDSDTIAADFADPAAARLLWDQAVAAGDGQIDVLVNNAGLFAASPIGLSDEDWLADWSRTLHINLTAAAQLSRLAIAHWRERGVPGRIVHIASRAGHRGDSPDHWHYAAAKGGMLAMHKTIARAYARDGILSFAIAPGFTDTAMAGDYLASRGGAGLLADIPLGFARGDRDNGRVLRARCARKHDRRRARRKRSQLCSLSCCLFAERWRRPWPARPRCLRRPLASLLRILRQPPVLT